MLQRVLRALSCQTVAHERVIVVDNASTDATPQVLADLVDELAVPLEVLRLDRNTGGAGGFHAGVERAVTTRARLLWLMDDDGTPPPTCLETLLGHVDRYDFVGPAVVAEHDPSRLCFPIRLPGSARVVHRLDDVVAAADGEVLEGVVIPFNGVLLTRELVERIGSPREEFFIWGDDVEYLWRAKRAGARVGTVVACRFTHPATDDLGTPMIAGRTTYNHSPSDLKHYCMARNNVVNLRDYVGWLGVLAFVVKTLWFYSVTRRDAGRLRLSLRAMCATTSPATRSCWRDGGGRRTAGDGGRGGGDLQPGRPPRAVPGRPGRLAPTARGGHRGRQLQ
jgi:rhamnopyranosyl-N-acetylglucosaminyl-diphospho-decaprenol beta-1,3/1,4-galactofuranosyltransferase